MRNKPLPGMMKHSPMKQKATKIPKDHPVTPPTKEESKKSKGTLSKDRSIKLIDKEHIKTQLKEGTFWVTPKQQQVLSKIKKAKNILKNK
jgi:hypothetical protein